MKMRYEVRRSTIGCGLFACTRMRKGERVIEYTGVRLPNSIADDLPTRYLFDLENGWTIDGTAYDNTARYVNHSCAPNCEAEIDGDRVFFHATRDIKEGEELTIDYGKEYFDEFIKPFGCKCTKCDSIESKNRQHKASGVSTTRRIFPAPLRSVTSSGRRNR